MRVRDRHTYLTCNGKGFGLIDMREDGVITLSVDNIEYKEMLKIIRKAGVEDAIVKAILLEALANSSSQINIRKQGNEE